MLRRLEFYLFTILFVVMASCVVPAFGQDFVPPVRSYEPFQYKAGTQNWGVAQDSKGIIYIANNQGLLCFDGKNWELYTLPKHKVVRCVFMQMCDDQERIYVGSFEEFGFFVRNAANRLVYTSLSDKLKEYSFQNDEVWSIVAYQNSVYFQTFSSYFKYDGKNIKTHKPYPAPFGIYPTSKGLYMQQIDGDFCEIRNDSVQVVLKQSQLNNDRVVGVFQRKDSMILATTKSGLFSYHLKTGKLRAKRTDIDAQLFNISVNRTLMTRDSLLVLGSLNEGAFVLNFQGKKIWHIDKNNGLKNNTVLGVFEDKQHNIWLALNNGISLLQPQSKLQYFTFQSDIELIEDMAQFGGKMYLASNKGIYEYHKGLLRKLPMINSQVWFVKAFDKQLFIGHNSGLSVITENQDVYPLANVGVGGTDIKKGVIHGQEVLIASSYTYLSIFKKDINGKWYVHYTLKDFSDLIQNIEIDHTGNIWANHPYKGVYRITLDETLTRIQSKKYYQQLSDQKPLKSIKLLKLRGRIILTDAQQFFTYNDESQSIIPYRLLNETLSNLLKTRKIVSVNDNLFWFITGTEYFLVAFNDKTYSIEDKIVFNSLLNPSNEERATIYVDKQGQSFFCLNQSLALYYLARLNQKSSDSNLFLSSVKTYNRGADRWVSEPISKQMSFDYAKNTMVFELQYPDFSLQNYQLLYRLEGYDKHWKTSADFAIAYQNLPQGQYLLKTQILTELGQCVASCQIPIEITSPWYKSIMAYLVYVGLFLGLLFLFIVIYLRYKLKKKEQFFASEKAKKEQILERQEKEIAKLQTEKLEAELQHKTKALASATMMNIKHDEFLECLAQDFQLLFKNQKLDKDKVHSIIRHIREHISTDDQWQLFQENFDMIHKNFFRNLKLKYPNLTSSDLKLCVLLRLNYTTKEIASMQGVSVRGVETARYRLRKKLNLPEEANLTDFLLTFE